MKWIPRMLQTAGVLIVASLLAWTFGLWPLAVVCLSGAEIILITVYVVYEDVHA